MTAAGEPLHMRNQDPAARVLPGVLRHASEYGASAAYRFRATGLVLLAAHLLLVGWYTLRPLTVAWMAPANLRPLTTIRAELALGPWQAAEHLGPQLLLLAPLGVLLPMACGLLASSPVSAFVRTVLTGAMVSLMIELLQSGTAGQVVDVDSLPLNTAGVALAHLALVPVLRVRLRRGERRGAVVPYADEEGDGDGDADGDADGDFATPYTRGGDFAMSYAGEAGDGDFAAAGRSRGATPRIHRVGIAPWADASSPSRT